MPGGPPNIDESFRSLEQLGFGAGREEDAKDRAEEVTKAFDPDERAEALQSMVMGGESMGGIGESAESTEVTKEAPEMVRPETAEAEKGVSASDSLRGAISKTSEYAQRARDGASKAYIASSNYLSERLEGLGRLLKKPFEKEKVARMREGVARGRDKTVHMLKDPFTEGGKDRMLERSETARAKRAIQRSFKEGKGRDAVERVKSGADTLSEKWKDGREDRRDAYARFKEGSGQAGTNFLNRIDDFHRNVQERRLEKKTLSEKSDARSVDRKRKKHVRARDLELKKYEPIKQKAEKKKAEIEAKRAKGSYGTDRAKVEMDNLKDRLDAAKARGKNVKGLQRRFNAAEKIYNKRMDRVRKEIGKRVQPKLDKYNREVAAVELKYDGEDGRITHLQRDLDTLNETISELTKKRLEVVEGIGKREVRSKEKKLEALKLKKEARLDTKYQRRIDALSQERKSIEDKRNRDVQAVERRIGMVEHSLDDAKPGSRTEKGLKKKIADMRSEISDIRSDAGDELKAVRQKEDRIENKMLDEWKIFEKKVSPLKQRIRYLQETENELQDAVGV